MLDFLVDYQVESIFNIQSDSSDCAACHRHQTHIHQLSIPLTELQLSLQSTRKKPLKSLKLSHCSISPQSLHRLEEALEASQPLSAQTPRSFRPLRSRNLLRANFLISRADISPHPTSFPSALRYCSRNSTFVPHQTASNELFMMA
jgi:hypothetical protein